MHLLLLHTGLDRMVSAFSWMLIHSLWQGLLAGVIGVILLAFTKRSLAVIRYNLLLLLLMGFVSACIFTFLWEWRHTPDQNLTASFANVFATQVSQLFSGNLHTVKQLLKMVNDFFSVNTTLVFTCWFVFFTFKSIKMFCALVYNHRIKNRRVHEPSESWKNAVSVLCEKLQISKVVTLLESGYIKMPVVVSHFKPVILMPVGILAGLPADQVEAILLHELAHIRRNDYLVNVAQNLMEIVFFFNPGLLWISSMIRQEREHCCDDMALAQTQNKAGFVEALISFKQYEFYGSAYSTAFPGKKNQLLIRVSRILSEKNKVPATGERLFFMTGIILLFAMITIAAIVQVKEPAERISPERNAVTASAPRHTAKLPVAKTPVQRTSAVRDFRFPGRQKMINDKQHLQMEMAPAIDNALPAITEGFVTDQQELTDKQRAEQDRAQAIKDKIQADKDQVQAMRDQQQAKLDQAQALKDQAQAKLDQQQAIKDKEAAEKMRINN